VPRRDHDEREHFRRLFDASYRPLLAYSRRRTTSAADAEEVVAETLLVAWRRRGEMPGGPDATRWLYGVARRVLANQRRDLSRRGRIQLAVGPPTGGPQRPDEAAEAADATRAVMAAARRLSEADRQILRLVAWEGLS
jgi:RNA polymerase sigma factor (sigma-70 family)